MGQNSVVGSYLSNSGFNYTLVTLEVNALKKYLLRRIRNKFM
jgi:hypothetical protein